MGYKSLDIFQMVLFGIGGIAILILTWVQPMPLIERILSMSIGSIGIFWVLIHVLLRKPLRAGTDRTPVTVKLDSTDK